MTRYVDDISTRVIDNKLSSFRFRSNGGKTGDHFIHWLAGEWRCDCQGWMFANECRHVKAGTVLLEKINEAILEINQREVENWQK